MLDYIEEYGNYSFKEKPFNEIDNLIFSQLAYTDFKNIADKQSVSLLKGAKLFFAMYTQQEIDELIAISAKSADLLRRCSMAKRFQNIILCDYINNVSDDIDKQFSAVHFLLDDGCDVVAFRGTDVTVTGVKESAMLSYMFPVPAQIEALYYFQETCMRHSGDIILCGHSKGGNLAVFAAVNCSNSLKKRLKAVYEDDAPGFPKYFLTDTIIVRLKIKFISLPRKAQLSAECFFMIQSLLLFTVKIRVLSSIRSLLGRLTVTVLNMRKNMTIQVIL